MRASSKNKKDVHLKTFVVLLGVFSTQNELYLISVHYFMVKEAKYRLIKKLDKVEIRLYKNLIIDEVDGYVDGGFNLLFNYISGNNTTQTCIKQLIKKYS